MLSKINNLVTGWHYNLLMVALWSLAFWRGSTRGWYIMMSVAGILCVLHSLMFVNALKNK